MNDHVFRETAEGLEFVGDFDALYRAEADPWEQEGHGASGRYYADQRRRLSAALVDHCGGDTVLEVGCGHGHAAAYIAAATGLQVYGMDISREAVSRAKQLHPALVFVEGDIAAPAVRYFGQFDAVVLNQVWWYLLDRLDQAIENAVLMTRRGGLLAISQAFLHEQRYGRGVADGFAGAIVAAKTRIGAEGQIIRAEFHAGERFDDGLILFRRGAAC